MKIAAIHNSLIIKRGAERAFLNMVVGLKNKQHEIEVYVFEISEDFKNQLREKEIEIKIIGFKPYQFQNFNAILYSVNVIRLLFRFYWISKNINKYYDVAFVHHSYLSTCIIPFLKIPKIYFCHEPPRMYYEPYYAINRKLRSYLLIPIYLLNKWIDRGLIKKVNLILTNSDYEREYIYRSYGKFAKTLRLGVDLEKFVHQDIKKEKIVISVGAIFPLKGFDFIISSLGKIEINKRPILYIVGSSSDADYIIYLNKLASDLGVDIKIFSNISDDELIKLYNKALMNVIGYIMEPSLEPEALGCEIPIVAVKEGGVRESVVDGVSGLLTDREPSEFAKCVEYLLDNPDVAVKMGQNGRTWISHNMTWDQCITTLEKNLVMTIASCRREKNKS